MIKNNGAATPPLFERIEIMWIAIKEVWGWTIKEYNNEVPDNKEFKIFKTKEDADNWIDEQ